MILRKYQEDSLDALADGRRKMFSRQLLFLPTGAGKTVVFMEYVRRALDAGRSALVLAHSEDLVIQAEDKAVSMGMKPGIEMNTMEASPDDRLVVASVASLWGSRNRVRREFDLIVVDECHHSAAPQWKRFLESLSPRFDKEYVGVTATPFRQDRQKLTDWWDRVAHEVTLTELIQGGYLADIMLQCLPVAVELPAVKGEMPPEQADAILNPILKQLAQAVVDATRDRRSIVVFLPLIQTSKRFASMLQECGVTAAHVDGTMDRADIMADFKAGRTRFLCNVAVLTEGWDEPCVDCVVPLRPIKSTSLYQQVVGRGTRLFPGKDHLVLLDLLWQTKQHYARPASLFSDDPELAYISAKAAVGKRLNLQDLAKETQNALRIARELALVRKTKAEARRKAYTVSLGDMCKRLGVNLGTGAVALDGAVALATEKQLKVLRNFKVVVPEGLTRAAASTLMGRLFAGKGRRKF